MKTFSLPKSFYDRICALPPAEMMRMLKAMYNYMYSNGTDTAIDKINSPKARPIINDFKAFATKKFAVAERSRQKRLEAKSRPKPEKVKESTMCFNGFTVKQMREHIATDFPDATDLRRIPASKILSLFNMLYCRFTRKDIRNPLLRDYIARHARAA